jgi:hypothetical protein
MIKKSQTRFFLLFLRDDKEPVPLSNGSVSGSGRPKNIRILRIRIRNTAMFIHKLYRAGELDGRAGPLSPSPPLHSTGQDPGGRRQSEPHGAAPLPAGGRQGDSSGCAAQLLQHLASSVSYLGAALLFHPSGQGSVIISLIYLSQH